METRREIVRPVAWAVALLALAGCGSEKQPAPGALDVDKARIVFDATQGAQASLTVEADRRWHVAATGAAADECTLSATYGDDGTTVLRLEIGTPNAGGDLRSLGALSLTLDDGSAARTVSLLQRPATARQTLLMFICGQDLYSYYKENLAGVARALSQNILPLGRILAFTQPTGSGGYVVEYRYDELANACRRDTLIRYTGLGPTTEPETMSRILCDMIAAAPAERYALQFGSHAKGWLPASIEKSSTGLSSAGLRDDLWRKMPGAPETRWFGLDRGRYMDIAEMVEALDATGMHFDYLLFDACFMSSVEALYDLRRTADYIVGSPFEVMAHGFPYDTVIPALFTDDGAGYDLTEACRRIYAYYSEEASTRSAGTAVTVCAELDALAAALRAIHAGPVREVDTADLQYYDGMKVHQFYDLEEYVLLTTASTALGEAFVRQMERCFPPSARFHTEQFFSAYNYRMNDIHTYSGVSTYGPAPTYRDAWQLTAWYAATHP